MTNAKVSPFQPVVTLGGKKLNDFGDRLDSERFRKVAAGRVLALRSHPNARGTQRAQAESVLCLSACAVAAVVRARLRTALIEGHLAIVDPLFVARLAAEPLLAGARRLDIARFAVGTRGRTGDRRRHQEHPRHHADERTRHHARRIAHRPAFFDLTAAPCSTGSISVP